MALTTYTAGEVLTAASLNDNFTFHNSAKLKHNLYKQVIKQTLTALLATSSVITNINNYSYGILA
jgi:hypothetical protein